MENRIKIAGEIQIIEEIFDGGYLPLLRLNNGTEWYLAESSEVAGEEVSEHYRDMAANDKAEFRCLIGDERLLKWSLNESDEFGISSAEDFFELVGQYPEEHWASYDGTECEVDRIGKATEEIGFIPTVAYRHN